MIRIGIIAAIPGELKHFVKGTAKRQPTSNPSIQKWSTTLCEYDVVAVCAGMGPAAVTRAFAEAEAEKPLEAVISIGWAGALRTDEYNGYPGDAFIPNVIVNAQTGERYKLAERETDVVLVSTDRVADIAEKRHLAETYGGLLVDMESATVLRLAEMRGIPVCCIKVITDEATANLPDINPFIDEMGQMKMAPFLARILLQPRYWRSLAKLGKASSLGAKILASVVTNFLICPKPRDFDQINRLGGIPDW